MVAIRLNALKLDSVRLDEQDEGLPVRIRVTMEVHQDDGSSAPPAPFRDALILHIDPDLSADLWKGLEAALKKIRT